MKKFAYFSDILFAFFLCATSTLVFFRYLGVSLPLALALSLLCGGLTALGIAALLRAKRKNLSLKRSDETEKQKLLLHLALLSDEAKTDFLQTALSTAEEPLGRFGKLRTFNKTEFYFLQFRIRPLQADEIPALARLKTGKKKILLCGSIEEEALDLCRRLNIEVRTGEWLYAKLKSLAALPDQFLGEALPTAKKRRVKLWFSKSGAKRFLVSGALILLLSRLTPFSYYYLLIGGVLLLIAIFVRIFGYTELG